MISGALICPQALVPNVAYVGETSTCCAPPPGGAAAATALCRRLTN